MGKLIYMLTGLSDIEVVGNQSLKSSIRYLVEFGYEIRVFSFMPNHYPTLRDYKEAFGGKVQFHRVSGALVGLWKLGRQAKDRLGKRKAGEKRCASLSLEEERCPSHGTYLREYNSLGRICYMAFLLVFYLPIEVLRVLWCSINRRPDILYGVNCQGAVAASLLGRTFRKPVVTRFHGASVSKDDLRSVRSRMLLLDELMGMTARTEAVIMTDDGTRGDEILRQLGVHAEKIYFWMNGVDTEDLSLPERWDREASRERLGIKGKVALLMVSRLVTWKRVDRGIRCVAWLRDNGFEGIVLLVAGRGPEQKALMRLVTRLDLSKKVSFLGSVPHEELSEVFGAVDVFLSLYDVSNHGNPLKEAMYYGLPIVTIDDGSTKGLLKGEENALLINRRELDSALPAAVRRLVENANLRKKLGESARMTFLDKVPSWQERMRLEDELLKRITERRNVGGSI